MTQDPAGHVPLPPAVLWDAAPDAMVLVRADGRIAAANLAAEQLFGHPVDALVGMAVEELVPRDQRETHGELRDRYAHRPARRPMGHGRRLQALRSDGSVIPVQISLSPVATDEGTMTIAAVRDVSEWLAAEERIAEANRRRMVAEDHDRIARELHDTVIQELFAMGMGLEAIVPETPDGPVAERIGRTVDTIDRVIGEIRTAIFGLQHAGADGESLRAQVVTVADLVAPTLGFDPKVCVEGPVEAVPDEVAQHVVPTVREALTNVARHAHATEATVAVTVTADRLRVEVVDDGVGFDTPPARRSGLGNLARRAALLGGRSEIESSAGGGTTFTWTVPLPTAS